MRNFLPFLLIDLVLLAIPFTSGKTKPPEIVTPVVESEAMIFSEYPFVQ